MPSLINRVPTHEAATHGSRIAKLQAGLNSHYHPNCDFFEQHQPDPRATQEYTYTHSKCASSYCHSYRFPSYRTPNLVTSSKECSVEAGNSNNNSSSNNAMSPAIVSGTGKLTIVVCSSSIRARAHGKKGRGTRHWRRNGGGGSADGMNSIVQ